MSNPIPSNKPGSSEFEETMRAFESMVLNHKGSPSSIREAREFWNVQAYYCDGQTNAHFKGYLHGIAYARSIANLALAA